MIKASRHPLGHRPRYLAVDVIVADTPFINATSGTLVTKRSAVEVLLGGQTYAGTRVNCLSLRTVHSSSPSISPLIQYLDASVTVFAASYCTHLTSSMPHLAAQCIGDAPSHFLSDPLYKIGKLFQVNMVAHRTVASFL